MDSKVANEAQQNYLSHILDLTMGEEEFANEAEKRVRVQRPLIQHKCLHNVHRAHWRPIGDALMIGKRQSPMISTKRFNMAWIVPSKLTLFLPSSGASQEKSKECN